jgi:uncharacterized protein YijF (DUF1287 family)
MSGPVETYSRRGFLYTAALAAVMTVAGGLVVYLSAAEIIDCDRSGGRVDCRFTRTLAGRYPIFTKTMHNLSSVYFAEHELSAGENQQETVTVYRLHVFGDNGDYLTVQTAEGEARAVQQRFVAMLRDVGADGFRARLSGSPRHQTWSAILLLLGVSLVPLWILGYFFPALRPRRSATTMMSLLLLVLAPSLAADPALGGQLAEAARSQVGVTRRYDPSYVRLAYPGGDVPPDRGVCTDVVVRAFRAIGVDLQVAVHEDMKANFRLYPQMWGLRRPDPNIDHRRVPNLMTFFARRGKSVARDARYLPGDVVVWRLSNGLHHIGVVSNTKNTSGDEYLVVHNIGEGALNEDVLRAFEIIGHYRW